jgi:hypothetical protein
MLEYTFKYGPFYFKIHAEEDKEAVTKARKALEESFPDEALDYLAVDLTAGAFMGRLYIEPGELSVSNICKKQDLPELVTDVPF